MNFGIGVKFLTFDNFNYDMIKSCCLCFMLEICEFLLSVHLSSMKIKYITYVKQKDPRGLVLKI